MIYDCYLEFQNTTSQLDKLSCSVESLNIADPLRHHANSHDSSKESSSSNSSIAETNQRDTTTKIPSRLPGDICKFVDNFVFVSFEGIL